MSTSWRALCAHGMLLWTFLIQPGVAIELHVAPHGDDQAEGTVDAPLASVSGARNRIRDLRAGGDLADEPVRVLIQDGDYLLHDTWTLTSEDSGTAEHPVVYQAAAGATVRLLAGQPLPPGTPLDPTDPQAARLSAMARQSVLVSDVGSFANAWGAWSVGGYDRPLSASPLELFLDGEPLPIASWPNHGWARVAVNSDSDTVIFAADDETREPFRATEAGDVWVHGFWKHDWADHVDAVASFVHSPNGMVTARLADHTELIRAGQRCRFLNALEALDQPGEWYLDRAQAKLYYWPPHDTAAATPVASLVETAISCFGVHHVHLVGLTIESARVMGVEIAGGSHVHLHGCQIRGIGNVGVHLYHGYGHEVTECEVAHTGDSAIRVEAGDRATLAPAQHRVARNDIHHFGRLHFAHRSGVDVDGVGIQIVNNHIHHGPDSAVRLAGNEHDVAYNEIDHVALETVDVGGIYLAHDPTYRGNQIRFNWLHDLGDAHPTGVIGIYLDDFASGTTVVGNVCQNTGRGIAVGGGRDNVIENNLVLDCAAGIQLDNRGTTWAAHWFAGESSLYLACLENQELDQSIYHARYPELATVWDDHPQSAKNNLVRLNAVFGPHGLELLDGLTTAEVTLEANHLAAAADVDMTALLAGNAAGLRALQEQGFAPIPWERIGRHGAPSDAADQGDAAPEALEEVSTQFD